MVKFTKVDMEGFLMENDRKRIKKICSFYVSEYHLVTMLLPYVKQKMNNKEKILILSEKDLRENMETLLSNINFTSEDKLKILDLEWNTTKTYRYSRLEQRMEDIVENQKNMNIIISGGREYIDITHKNIENWLNKTRKNYQQLSIIDCYEMMQFNENIKDILDIHEKILNTAGEKEIGEIFEGYEKKEAIDIAK